MKIGKMKAIYVWGQYLPHLDKINFMSKFGRGLICVTLTEQKADQLDVNYGQR